MRKWNTRHTFLHISKVSQKIALFMFEFLFDFEKKSTLPKMIKLDSSRAFHAASPWYYIAIIPSKAMHVRALFWSTLTEKRHSYDNCL